jgi:hypothetical protein
MQVRGDIVMKPALVRIADGGLAIDVFPGHDMLSNIRTWRHGVQAELSLETGDELYSVTIRPAREGEPALKMKYSPAGPFFRIPMPLGVAITEQCHKRVM